jgi:predicted regulator of Ras-like GTPase activity (Roadblock/LC7/MglB family)
MNQDLANLIKDIRDDLGTDFIATDIIDLDGMSIAGDKSDSNFNSELVAAHFTMVMKLATKVSGNMDTGTVSENLVSTENSLVFSRFLGDASLYWLLATTKDATLGIVRTLMDEYELKLWGALPN